MVLTISTRVISLSIIPLGMVASTKNDVLMLPDIISGKFLDPIFCTILFAGLLGIIFSILVERQYFRQSGKVHEHADIILGKPFYEEGNFLKSLRQDKNQHITK